MSMIKSDPVLQAKALSKKLGMDIVAAYDGMVLS